MTNNEYVRLSLELHLFFDRIMKEHSLFLETAFMEKDNELKKVANRFQNNFSEILKRTILLASGRVSYEFLQNSEIVTKNTLEAEEQTSKLSGSYIDTNITLSELNLKSGEIYVDNEFLNNVSSLNKYALPVIEELIKFKQDILNKVLTCKMYTTNYPLLITHIMNEAKMYYSLLINVEKREKLTSNEIYQQELFWNNIMKEHAEFIRCLLDPSEHELIIIADEYADKYENILKQYGNNPMSLTQASLNNTKDFKKIKIAGEEGILNCKIKSIIIPLLADHIVREANHFIRILESFSM